MKRLSLILCVAITLALLCVVGVRVWTRKSAPRGIPSQEQVHLMHTMADSLAQVKTRSLSLDDFSHAIRLRVGTNLNGMPANEREKLFACIDRFYACYSSGDFEAFKRFRMHPPFTVSKPLAEAAGRVASEKGMSLNSEEDIIHFAWDNYNGTNKIGEVDVQSISLSITNSQNLGRNLRQSSNRGVKLPGLGASCWEGAVVYQPAPDTLQQKEGSLRFFRLEVCVRFSPFDGGPATPLVLIGYWDTTREDWMPYCLCRPFHAGSYDTIF